MSRYRKIEVRTWADERFRRLSPIPPSGQGLWFFLLTGPHTGPIPGLFRAGRAAMAEELDWDVEAFDEAFQEVSEQGMAKADFKARLVWLPKAIRYNKPESPNVVRGWRVELDLLPECDLKREAIEAIREALSDAGPSYVEAFEEVLSGKGKATSKADEKPSAKPSAKTMPNQEQEQEQEQERVAACADATTQQPNPKPKTSRGSRLARDWVLPSEWGEWAERERPDLDPQVVAERFRDHWVAKAGRDGCKLDWFATWRNWVRNERSLRPAPVGVPAQADFAGVL